ncbi:putative glycoside hydrolase [Abyssisolibacter fermentans]|uniref:putative glycoside hydrolase n=1 Tax=Abyssisolibacter fermentans TaxID=1766203 RepID=UPI00082D5822|nr:putative glycoside hydrolase [Abyssisolibacter fermentans]
MKKSIKNLASFFVICSLLITTFSYPVHCETDNISSDLDNSVVDYDYLKQPQVNWEAYKEKVEVRGIYVTANSLGNKASFDRLLGIVKNTEINAMVIDIKEDLGILAYKPDIEFVKQNGLDKNTKVRNFYDRIETLKKNNVYLIARIVTFKDTNAGSKRPDLAIKTKSGRVWRDNKGNVWLNPFNEQAWEYPISIAADAALNGFNEIQFDYVRFPTGGNKGSISYGQAEQSMTKADAISGFLKKAREELEPLGVYVSADIFGDIINNKNDSGIGQNLEMLAGATDILCPMVYPSHYAMGSYGAKYPDSQPYTIVYNAMKRAKDRIDKSDNSRKAILRPWLQDFSATWLKKDYGSNWIPYKEPQIQAQIKATKDAGLNEWIFWNASNRYTVNAFKNLEQ